MLKKIWHYGTATPFQRVGVILLTVGLMSLISWMIKEELVIGDIFNSYSYPRSRDSIFFHLYFYLIPLGLILSWGYIFLTKIKLWILMGYMPKNPPLSKINKSKTTSEKKLHFKSNGEAFKFAVKINSINYQVNSMYFGIVQDISLLKDGSYQFLVQLADMDRTVLVNGYNDKYSDKISIGNLVYWGYIDDADSNQYNIEALGHILATLYPEYNPNNLKWSIKENLTSK